MGRIFYLMGKSASGKDSIYRELMRAEKPDLKKLILYTTRPVRDDEKDGREYFFVTEERLEELRRQGKIIEERLYHTVHGPWIYFTADDGQVDLENADYLGIGTLESFCKLRDFYGNDRVCPIYIEVEDGERLTRALTREKKQDHPRYEEMCRRFLADQEDFSEEKLREAGIQIRFENKEKSDCIGKILTYIQGIE